MADQSSMTIVLPPVLDNYALSFAKAFFDVCFRLSRACCKTQLMMSPINSYKLTQSLVLSKTEHGWDKSCGAVCSH